MSGPRTLSAPTGWQFSRAACLAREALARLLGIPLGWVLEGPAVEGREHLAAIDGPMLVCPTHASHFDVSAVRLALGTRHRFRLAEAAAADYFTVSRVRWFFAAWLGAFAFKRTGRGADSIAMAEGVLGAGWNLVVFPEGTRSLTGEIGPFRPGAGLIAVTSGCPALPVRVRGIADVLPKGSRWPRRHPVTVTFGPLIRPLQGEGAREFTSRLEAAVRAL